MSWIAVVLFCVSFVLVGLGMFGLGQRYAYRQVRLASTAAAARLVAEIDRDEAEAILLFIDTMADELESR